MLTLRKHRKSFTGDNLESSNQKQQKMLIRSNQQAASRKSQTVRNGIKSRIQNLARLRSVR